MKRLVVACAAIVTAVALVQATAWASWLTGGAGSARSLGTALASPSAITATPASSSVVTVGWAAPTSGPVPTSYTLRRTSPTAATICTLSAAPLSCSDTGLAAATTYSYVIDVRLGTSWSRSSGAVSATTLAAAQTYQVALPAPGNKTAGTAFSVVLTAQTGGVTDTSYNGVKTVTFSGPANSPLGTTPTYPATVTFTNGVGTASITLVAAQSVTLSATDGTRTGSTSVTVVGAAANRLTFVGSTPSCAAGSVAVGNGGSFVSAVGALDSFGNRVALGSTTTVSATLSAVTGTVTLSGVPLSIPSGQSQTSGSLTVAHPTGGGQTRATVTATASGLTSVSCATTKT